MCGANALAPHHGTQSALSVVRSCTSVAAYATSLRLALTPAWTTNICAPRLQEDDCACLLHCIARWLWRKLPEYLVSACVGAVTYVRKLQMACMMFSSYNIAVWELQLSNSLLILLQEV